MITQLLNKTYRLLFLSNIIPDTVHSVLLEEAQEATEQSQGDMYSCEFLFFTDSHGRKLWNFFFEDIKERGRRSKNILPVTGIKIENIPDDTKGNSV